jgi:3,2-trans-enoyl-CoA isomerase
METLKIIKKKNYAIVEINNGKVNAINEPLGRDLIEAFSQLGEDDEVKGVILAGRPNCFSAGLDIVSLAQADREGGKNFWRAYLGAIQTMIRFPKPLVCAITGYAPAGATIITLCADYRVMAKGDKHKVGMHEFKLSMLIPEMMSDVYAYHLGEKAAWKAVQQARLFSSDEALEIGLVDESVEVDQVLERAEKHLKKMVGVYSPVYAKSKEYFRKALLKIVDRPIEPMIEDIAQGYDDPFVKQSMSMFLASLKK